eukprot:jgi/Psemu1/39721/gm1.39721_g
MTPNALKNISENNKEEEEDAANVVVSAGCDEACFLKKDVYAPPLEMEEEEEACAANNKILQCNAKMAEAQADYLNNAPHGDRRYCLVVDYCQNAQLPNLCATQPGDVYYTPALTVAILGIVAQWLAAASMHTPTTRMLEERAAIRNVASIRLLTVLMDNCGGQNKNNNALRLANVLVEAGYFKKVNFMFYAVGRTKNVADYWWFNTMKKDYPIKIHSVKDSDFKNFREFEDLLYKDLESGSIQPGHVFSVESHAPTVINVFFDLLGTLPEIKQIELYEKWRKLVPPEFADIICPYPGDEVMRKFKDERNH